jgi:hypothetical protein
MVRKMYDFKRQAAAVQIILVILLGSFMASQTPALADQWVPARTKTYYSNDHRVRFTVIPRSIQSPLAYFQDKVEKRNQAGQKPGGSPFARGILERKDRGGRWIAVWDKHLGNDVSPVSALVTNSGRYVVTFDNWGSMGWGNDVVVIYGPDGSVVRSLSVHDILPNYYVMALPRSVSSIWWSGKHRVADPNDVVMLKIVVPDGSGNWETRNYVEVPLVLSTGQVLPNEGPAWEKALAQAEKVGKKQLAEDEAWFADFKSPLLGPKDNNWEHYLFEAYNRLDPDWRNGSGFDATFILPAPDDADYETHRTLLRDLLLEAPPSMPNIVIASPASNDNLVNVLSEIAREATPDKLKQRRVYVVAPAVYRDRLAAIFLPTGATFTHLDPTLPIPQRQERIDEYRRDYEATWHTKLD